MYIYVHDPYFENLPVHVLRSRLCLCQYLPVLFCLYPFKSQYLHTKILQTDLYMFP